jgi:hypothetical protein
VVLGPGGRRGWGWKLAVHGGHLFDTDLLTDLEPGEGGGITIRSRSAMTRGGSRALNPGFRGARRPPPRQAGRPPLRTHGFMGRNVFQKLDTHWDHEPWSEECSERPSPRPSPGGRGRIFPAGFEGLGRVLAGTGRDGSDGWSSGMSPCGICGSLSPRERVGVREPVSTLAIAATERFMGSAVFETDLLTDHEPLEIHHRDTESQRYQRSVLLLRAPVPRW